MTVSRDNLPEEDGLSVKCFVYALLTVIHKIRTLLCEYRTTLIANDKACYLELQELDQCRSGFALMKAVSQKNFTREYR